MNEIVVSFAFYFVFFKDAVLEEGDAAFELFSIDNDCVAFLRVDGAEPKGSLDLVEHGNSWKSL